MPRMRWVRLWTQETLYGTTNRELTLEERAIWFEMLALAGDSPTPGIICVSPGVSLTDAQLSSILDAPEALIRQAKTKLSDPQINKININGTGCIQIVNWSRYQSEFDRESYQREYMRSYRERKSYTRKSNVGKSQQQNRTEGKGREQKRRNPPSPHTPEDKTSASPTPPPTTGASLDLQGWLDWLASSDNHVGILGEMITTLRGGEVSLSRLASVLGRIYYRDAGNMAGVIWKNKDRQISGDFLSYVEMAKGGEVNHPPGGKPHDFEEDNRIYERNLRVQLERGEIPEHKIAKARERLGLETIPPSPLSGKGGDDGHTAER